MPQTSVFMISNHLSPSGHLETPRHSKLEFSLFLDLKKNGSQETPLVPLSPLDQQIPGLSAHLFSFFPLHTQLQDKEPEGATPKELMFSINPTRVEDLSTFGPKIAGMCQGIPTYVAEEIPGVYPLMLCTPSQCWWSHQTL